MTKYIALLRGINVGGKNIIKMDLLRELFESLKFQNVKTYIQSGNVIFETKETDKISLAKRIEKELHKHLDDNVMVFLRTLSEFEKIVKSNPFKKIKFPSSTKLYVSFVENKLNNLQKLPIVSIKKDVEIFEIIDCEVFSITREINGRFGFPNIFVEKEFKVSATTRNWDTVCKLLGAAVKS
jgi:uncharacterized protein (DUF1697 family)